ncbi:MAG TPA: archaeosortase A [Archaeoglobaceae archaeon]|nr:archaeosortase A [Archaeoglobaceae archaeon]
MDILIVLSIVSMILFLALKNRVIGAIAWIIFGTAWIFKVPYYYSIGDYFNITVVTLAFLFFVALGLRILVNKEYLNIFVGVTAFSALSALVYFPFAFEPTLNKMIIENVAYQTSIVANSLGFEMQVNGDVVTLNNHEVQIILACTGIESMALFAGATLGIRTEWRRKVKAFLLSVPVIYALNLLRNVFVTTSFVYEWFGENSFYIAHHIISKVLATTALILISLAVFRVLPELADLILELKKAMTGRWRS